MVEDIDRVLNPEIGKFYLVSAVRTKKFRIGNSLLIARTVVPVMGEQHTDPDIGFPNEHLHIDWRFLEEKIFRQFARVDDTGLSFPLVRILLSKQVEGSLGKVALQYKRHIPFEKRFWWPKLEEKYKNSTMKNNVCPHRGIICKNANAFNGVVVCSGHGLAWSMLDGRMVPRKELIL